jgi:hypothetical protein
MKGLVNTGRYMFSDIHCDHCCVSSWYEVIGSAQLRDGMSASAHAGAYLQAALLFGAGVPIWSKVVSEGHICILPKFGPELNSVEMGQFWANEYSEPVLVQWCQLCCSGTECLFGPKWCPRGMYVWVHSLLATATLTKR